MLKQYKVAAIGMVCVLTAVAGQSVSKVINDRTAINHTEAVVSDSPDLTEEAVEKEELLGRMAVSRQMVSLTEESGEVESQTEMQSEVETAAALEEETESVLETEAESEILIEETAEVSVLDGYAIPTVEDYLNIRSIPSTDGEILGKLYEGTKAEILEEENDWYKIRSGSVEGYIYKPYTVTGKEAEDFLSADGYRICNVLTGGLRVRENPGTDADVLDIVGEGDQFGIFEVVDGWVAVDYEGETAYLAADYVSVDYDLGEAISIEEEQAALQAAVEEAAKAEREQQETVAVSNKKEIETVQRDGVAASYDDAYLLACVIYMEAGWEPYEGQLAVANVVLNRVKAGYGTISDVIYAKGQFSGANSGALARVIAQGPNQSSVNAANEALSGVNNIGNLRHFIAVSHASYGAYSEYTIIGNHCFYN